MPNPAPHMPRSDLSSASPHQGAPDYTVPALVMGLVNLLWIFFALWAVWGMGAVMAAAYLVFLGIDILAQRKRISDQR
ncbi:hypothetical protein [Pseudooceanicola sp. HF7]|uniref:hypothetical protein n=1 Tax=Pseudooceanicola sp. HF7 TaxID=2721560 RepID=UPI0020CA3FE4|nr:hypothetical protein [Pseudooceanicola sp. HF7]